MTSLLYKLLRKTEKYTHTDMIYLAKGGFWLTIGQFISIVAGFILAIAFANLLPKEVYGNYKYILSISSILSISALPGMNTSILKSVAQGKEGSILPALRTKIKWSVLGSVASLIVSGYYFLNDNTTLTFGFLITALFLPSMYALSIYSPILQGQKRFKKLTQYNNILNVLTALVIVGVLALSNNLFVILVTYFAIYSVIYLFLLIRVIKNFKTNNDKDVETVKYGKNLSAIQLISNVANQIDKVLIFHFLGSVQLAIYSFAIAPPDKIKTLFMTVRILAQPKLSQTNIDEIKKTLPGKLIKMAAVIVVPTILYILAAPYIYQYVFPEYMDSMRYSQIFALSLLLYPKALLGSTMSAHAKIKEIYILDLTTPIVKILLVLILTPMFNIWGAIYAYLVTELVNMILAAILFKRLKN